MRSFFLTRERIIGVCAAVPSALLLILASPAYTYPELIWVALIPVFLFFKNATPKNSFISGFLCGLLFYLKDLSWILNLLNFDFMAFWVITGWLLLSGYCALYFGIFGYLLSSFIKIVNSRISSDKELSITLKNICIMLSASIFWVGLDYLRATLFTGFPWSMPAMTQYENLSIIQIADIFGIYGITAVIVIVNVGIAFVLLRFVDIYARRKRPRFQSELMFSLFILLLCWIYGIKKIKEFNIVDESRKVVISTVQPNIATDEKWNPLSINNVQNILKSQTELCALSSPKLIIWPETSLPTPLNQDEYMQTYVSNIVASTQIPLLLGSIEVKSETFNEKSQQYVYELHNSAFFVETNGISTDIYRKNHLVMFGEYIPLENIIKPLKKIAPLGFSCIPGKTPVIFELPNNNSIIKFSTLICFEDAFSSLSAESVKKGADFLINLTNDGWFDGTHLPMQHFANSLFRAVETRRPLIRSTNSGITAFIQPDGNSFTLKDSMGNFRFQGFLTYKINLLYDHQTIYTRFGNTLLAIPAAIITVIMGIYLFFRRKDKA